MAFVQSVGGNDYVGQIPDMEFFREDTINISFRFWYPPDRNGIRLPIDLTNNIKPIWYLCPYRQYQNPVIIKEMLVSRTQKNLCSVVLTADDTRGLDFIKYTHQPVLETLEDRPSKYIRAEGSIMFHPHISSEIY